MGVYILVGAVVVIFAIGLIIVVRMTNKQNEITALDKATEDCEVCEEEGEQKKFSKVNEVRTREKDENKEKILELFSTKNEVRNNDIEELLDVSDSSVGRYLDELQEEGKIEQHGNTGKSVFYTLIK